MIKFIVFLTKIVLTTAISLLFASCQMHVVKGSGNVTSEDRSTTEEFKSIEASKGLKVVLEQSDKASVTVVADDNLQKHIFTKVEHGVLNITSDVNSFINVKSKKVVVKMPVIENIIVSSGANLSSKNTLKSNNLTMKSSSGSGIDIAIEADKASCTASSGSNISVNGKAITLETSASSGSEIEAEKLLSNDIVAKASSGSSIDVNPLVSLDAQASSGGSINYHSIPKVLHKKSSSGGSIDKD